MKSPTTQQTTGLSHVIFRHSDCYLTSNPSVEKNRSRIRKVITPRAKSQPSDIHHPLMIYIKLQYSLLPVSFLFERLQKNVDVRLWSWRGRSMKTIQIDILLIDKYCSWKIKYRYLVSDLLALEMSNFFSSYKFIEYIWIFGYGRSWN